MIVRRDAVDKQQSHRVCNHECAPHYNFLFVYLSPSASAISACLLRNRNRNLELLYM